MTPSMRLLLVDDNPDDRALVLRALKKEFPGLEAEEVIDAESLDAALFRGAFDLAVTDYQLLWSNGLEVLQRVKFRLPDCPVLMFTATGSEEIAVDALKKGLDDYVIKSPRHFARLASAARKAMEHAVQRNRSRHLEFRLEDLLSRLNVGVCRADFNGTVLYANPAFFRIFALPETSLDSLDLNTLIAMTMKPAALREELRNHGQVRLPEMKAGTGDRPIWISAVLTLGKASPDEVVEFLIEDITERKRLDQELKDKEEEMRQLLKLESIGRLAGGVAHDFNNLLTAINGYSEMILEMLQVDNPMHESMVEILKAGMRATDLTRDLLAFGRRQVMNPREFDLNRLIESMKSKLRSVIGMQLDLEVKTDSKPVKVHCDPNQLENVILNLAGNARDAMPQAGKLTLRTANMQASPAGKLPPLEGDPQGAPWDKEGYAMLTVEDTGSGMPPEVAARVFEPFFTTKVMGKGKGMGLSTAYGIIKQSGGHISVESEPGKGTRFRICLPQPQRTEKEDTEPVPSLM